MKAKYQVDGIAYHNHYKYNVFRNFCGTQILLPFYRQTILIPIEGNAPVFV